MVITLCTYIGLQAKKIVKKVTLLAEEFPDVNWRVTFVVMLLHRLM